MKTIGPGEGGWSKKGVDNIFLCLQAPRDSSLHRGRPPLPPPRSFTISLEGQGWSVCLGRLGGWLGFFGCIFSDKGGKERGGNKGVCSLCFWRV